MHSAKVLRSATRALAWVSVAVFLCALPRGADAQDLPSQPAIETELTAAPRPGQSGASLTIGGQVQEGRTATMGLSITGVAAHTTERHQLLRFDFTDSYAKYRPATTGPNYLAEDNQLATFTYLQTVKTRFAVIGEAGWRRDEILGLDYRWSVEGGGGVELFATKKVNAFVGGTYAVGREHRAFTTEGESVLDAGVLQTFNLMITPVLGFHEWFVGHVQTDDTSDHSYQFSAALLARVSKHAGLKITYARENDSLHLPSVSETQSKLVFGVQVSFEPAPPKP